jgi:serine/threonine protein kinase/formylglycine-generating enzyme required for sulfatase activity
MSLLPGNAKILEYKIIDHLGSGGFANTYSALDTNLDKKVAIKEFFPLRLCHRGAEFRVEAQPGKEVQFQDFLANFIEEARILAKFDQPNIVKVLRYFEALGTGFIIMEFVDGKPIGDFFAYDNILGEDRIGRWLNGLLRGLETVHAANLIHGDIKPLNIIIDRDDKAVLIDFGASAIYRSADPTQERHLSPNYAAPEQLTGSRHLDHRVDLYSLGAVFFEAVTGDKLTKVREHGDDVGRELLRYRKFYNAKLLTSIVRAVSEESRLRFSSAQEWREQILLSPSERMGAFYRRRRKAIAAGVVFVVVVAGAAVIVERNNIDARNYRYKLFASNATVVEKMRQGEGYRDQLRDALAALDTYEVEFTGNTSRLDPQNLITGRNNVAALTGVAEVLVETRRQMEGAERSLALLQENYYFDDYAGILAASERVIQNFSARQIGYNRALLSAFVEDQIVLKGQERSEEIDPVALDDLMTQLEDKSDPLALDDLVSVASPIVDRFLAEQARQNAIAALEALRAKTIAEITVLADRYAKNNRHGEFAALVDEANAAERPNQLLASLQRAKMLAREIDSARAAAAAKRAKIKRQSEIRTFVAKVDREMVKVDPGVFQMGSNKHGYSRPPRAVNVLPFYMLKNEVANAQWDECVKSRECPPRDTNSDANDPVTGVSWDDAQIFIGWLNKQGGRFTYRLPTEAEWEYVVRTFGYVGKELNSGISSVTVAQTNNGGFNSIVGNALEWLDDCWHGGYVGAPDDSRSWNRGLQCDLRVVRGSNWQGEHDINVGNVAFYRPFGLPRTEARPTLGFRLAGELKL